MFSGTVLNISTLETQDPRYRNVILLQELPDTSTVNTNGVINDINADQLDIKVSDNSLENQIQYSITEQNKDDQNKDETIQVVNILTDGYQLVKKEGEEQLSQYEETNSLAKLLPMKPKVLKKVDPTLIPKLKRRIQLSTNGIPNLNHTNPQRVHAKTFVPQLREVYKSLISNITDNNPTKIPAIATIDDRKKDKNEPVQVRRRRNIVHNFLPISDRIIPPRAFAVLPTSLQCRRDVISPYRRALPPKVRFGPVVGIHHRMSSAQVKDIVTESKAQHRPVFLLANNDDSVTFIDTSDQDKCNWISLLPLGDQSTANVWLQQVDGSLYAFTTSSIQTQTPLKLGYCKYYAEKHGIPDDQPILDLYAELQKVTEWWCNECSQAMPSLLQLQIHVDKHHTDHETSKGRYRCKYCTRRYARPYCLKRHITKYCTEVKKQIAKKQAEQEIDDQNTVPTEDSNRLPSDESLQNYTNILDISASFFDPDRISNLDISGFKDDIRLGTDFDFSNGLLDGFGDIVKSNEEVAANEDVKKDIRNVNCLNENYRNIRSSSPFSCPYCKLNMTRSKLNHHARVCSSRRFDCVCGVKFRSEKKLSAHILTAHPVTEVQAAESSVKVEKDNGGLSVDRPEKRTDEPYQCKECGMNFKRRGMYINHMRAHDGGGGSAEIPPLWVRERRFPCPACRPCRLYRARDKRDRHCRTHHPGLVYDRMSSVILGARKEVAPAMCTQCPKQYATRAKLLQHMRMKHPNHQIEEPKKKPKKKTKIKHERKKYE